MQGGTDFRPVESQQPTWPLSQSLKQQIAVLKVGPWAAALLLLCPDRWRQSLTGISKVNKKPKLCRRSTRGLFCRSHSQNLSLRTCQGKGGWTHGCCKSPLLGLCCSYEFKFPSSRKIPDREEYRQVEQPRAATDAGVFSIPWKGSST